MHSGFFFVHPRILIEERILTPALLPFMFSFGLEVILTTWLVNKNENKQTEGM